MLLFSILPITTLAALASASSLFLGTHTIKNRTGEFVLDSFAVYTRNRTDLLRTKAAPDALWEAKQPAEYGSANYTGPFPVYVNSFGRSEYLNFDFFIVPGYYDNESHPRAATVYYQYSRTTFPPAQTLNVSDTKLCPNFTSSKVSRRGRETWKGIRCILNP